MRIFLVLIALVVGACSSETEEDPIGETYHEALDEAEAVEATVEEQAEATRKAIEEAEGN